MPLRERLDILAQEVNSVCQFTKSVSFYLLEVVAWLIVLYIVGKAVWHGLQ